MSSRSMGLVGIAEVHVCVWHGSPVGLIWCPASGVHQWGAPSVFQSLTLGSRSVQSDVTSLLKLAGLAYLVSFLHILTDCRSTYTRSISGLHNPRLDELQFPTTSGHSILFLIWNTGRRTSFYGLWKIPDFNPRHHKIEEYTRARAYYHGHTHPMALLLLFLLRVLYMLSFLAHHQFRFHWITFTLHYFYNYLLNFWHYIHYLNQMPCRIHLLDILIWDHVERLWWALNWHGVRP